MSVFVFDYRRPGIILWPIDDQLPHLVKICRRHGFGERQLLGKDRRDTNFVWLDVHIWRDDRTSGMIDTFTLRKELGRQ